MLTWQVAYAPPAPPAAPLVAAGLRGGGDVAAPPIGQPSDRSISAQSRLQIRERCWRRRRSQRRRQQLPLLSQRAEKRRRPAMHDEGSAGRASAGPVAPSAHDCRRPDERRRATADGGAVSAAAAAPPVGGALVVAWAALRRRSADGTPGQGWQPAPACFELPARCFEMPAPCFELPAPARFSLLAL